MNSIDLSGGIRIDLTTLVFVLGVLAILTLLVLLVIKIIKTPAGALKKLFVKIGGGSTVEKLTKAKVELEEENARLTKERCEFLLETEALKRKLDDADARRLAIESRVQSLEEEVAHVQKERDELLELVKEKQHIIERGMADYRKERIGNVIHGVTSGVEKGANLLVGGVTKGVESVQNTAIKATAHIKAERRKAEGGQHGDHTEEF